MNRPGSMVAPLRASSTEAAGAEGQTSAPALPVAGGDPTAADGDGTGRRMLHPDPPLACPCCGQRLKRKRGRPGADAGVVALVVELRGEGLSTVAVARELERRGVPTVQGGERWRASSVSGILRRTLDAAS